MARIADLVKTYKLINDPNAPPWSVRFVGALVVLGALVAAGSAAWLLWPSGDEPAAALSAEAPAGDDASVSRVAVPADEDAAQAALDAWRRLHPDAQVVSVTPVHEDGRLVAYDVRHQP